MDYGKMSVDLHRKTRGKISMHSKVPLESVLDMSLAYTPGVAQVSLEVAADKALAYELTNKGNMIAVVSDGSAVLGLGNIGPEGAMPVMEGKAVLFRELAGIDATLVFFESARRLAPALKDMCDLLGARPAAVAVGCTSRSSVMESSARSPRTSACPSI